MFACSSARKRWTFSVVDLLLVAAYLVLSLLFRVMQMMMNHQTMMSRSTLTWRCHLWMTSSNRLRSFRFVNLNIFWIETSFDFCSREVQQHFFRLFKFYKIWWYLFCLKGLMSNFRSILLGKILIKLPKMWNKWRRNTVKFLYQLYKIAVCMIW